MVFVAPAPSPASGFVSALLVAGSDLPSLTAGVAIDPNISNAAHDFVLDSGMKIPEPDMTNRLQITYYVTMLNLCDVIYSNLVKSKMAK